MSPRNSSVKMSPMRQERVTLSRGELKRVKVLERVLSSAMNNEEGAITLGVSLRQLMRLKKKYIAEGERGLIHANTGRKPKHATTEERYQQVIRLYTEKYYDSNFCHFSDLLAEHEDIILSPSSVGRILQSVGIKSKKQKRRSGTKHPPRNRRTQAGMLWQTDATKYAWLENRAEPFTLHAAIDDATGIVTGAVFTLNECAYGYGLVMIQGIEKYGIPLGLYSDRHTIFRSPNEKQSIEEEFNGEEIPLSNFGKAMQELNIEHIKARTPQAKGRIERLWNTLQDRLAVELRIRGITDMAGANKVLPELIARHNERFSVVPQEENNAYVDLGGNICLTHVFSMRETRKIGGGNTISYKGNTYKPVNANRYSFDSKTIVEVRETFDGKVLIWHNAQGILLEKTEKYLRQVPNKELTLTRKTYKQSADHPWRNGFKDKDLPLQITTSEPPMKET